ncbi:1-phosphofructokinase [Paenibacillus massiliensis]|uniref:1-phosphofructokinase n=2 Tax=Paenibacillus massiliensis TaxID=225917 RepID=UPI0003700B03|nr:1-phosphofructokinase [Paenibacillus massiliensis]
MKNKVLTVTLNPALDKTVTLPGFQVGGLNRIEEMRVDAGGKGINVAKVLKSFNEPVVATGFAGGYAGTQLLDRLQVMRIEQAFVKVEGETRTNLKIVDSESKVTTEVNERGNGITAEEASTFHTQLERLLGEVGVLVLGGSLQPGMPEDTYRQIGELAKSKGVKTILDADGEAFRQGLQAIPFAVKPNIHELEQLVGKPLDSDDAVIQACQSLLEQGIEWVVVSMGGDGSILVSADEVIRARPFPIVPQSTVGAGDSMVAAISACLLHNRSLLTTARWATAAGSITASKPGTEVCTLAEVESHLEAVDIQVIHNAKKG